MDKLFVLAHRVNGRFIHDALELCAREAVCFFGDFLQVDIFMRGLLPACRFKI